MSGNRFKITSTSLKKLCVPPDPSVQGGQQKPRKQALYWDTELKGFGVVVGQSRKSFIVQRDIQGRSVRTTIGPLGVWTVTQARRKARELIVLMDQGIDPNRQAREKAARGITLGEALEMHLSAMRAKRCSERSLQTIQDDLPRHLSDWLPRPLSAITRNDCAIRHQRITKSAGPYAANRVLQQFRACYNTAARRMESLPPNPVVGVTFNKTRRRREPIPWSELPAWREKVEALKNPVRSDLQLFILFTGLRSHDARTVKREHIDFEAGTLHRPKPKGGEDRAFTVPISSFVLDLLKHRKEENGLDDGWVFPAHDRSGNLTHVCARGKGVPL